MNSFLPYAIVVGVVVIFFLYLLCFVFRIVNEKKEKTQTPQDGTARVSR